MKIAKTRLVQTFIAASALAVLTPSSWAQGQGRQVLTSSYVPAAVSRLAPVQPLMASKRLNLAIGLPLRHQDELNQLLGQLYDPASPLYRQYLTPEQFTERFGPTKEDYEAVIEFARAHNLAVTGTHPNRLVLDVEGAAVDVEKAFNVKLQVYAHPTEPRSFYAPNGKPSIDLTVPVLSVSGLDNFSIPHPNHRIKPIDNTSSDKTGNATPKAGSGPGGTYRGTDFTAAYVPGTTLNGSGQSVALLQFDGYYPNDIATYVAQAGLPSVTLSNIAVNGGVATPGGGNGEVCLDIEMVISMAPGLSKIYVYEAPNGSTAWVTILSKIANDDFAKSIGCSWGNTGPGQDPAGENVFLQMAAQGQSFFNATGDSDAFTGGIPFPSESTNITQVGGTTLSTTGPGGSYVSETVWNWGGGQGSSGGISTFYSIPFYQLGISMTANLGSTTMRNVPDVALTADNVYVTYNNGSTGSFGGTSCAAPLWAGFTALVNQQAAISGRPPVGFLNPALYTIGKGADYSAGFRDTTTGNNTSTGSPTQFFATAGYDLCTGWGTPKGVGLINLLAGPPVGSNSFAIVTENCTNGIIDSGEIVTVNLGLKNFGTSNTTNLVGTLQTSGGVILPSAPQNYGALVAGGSTVTKSFSFTAATGCGSIGTATLQLQDGAVNVGNATFSFRIGQLTPLVVTQNFDGVIAPALPAGWTTATSGSQSLWVTSISQRDTLPNSMFSPDPAAIGVNELDSPVVVVASTPAQLSFRHSYNLEATYDGGVLEIKIGSGAWTDIITAGGSFAVGAYNGTVDNRFGNPLGGLSAWTGNSGGFVTTTVNLPIASAGQSTQFRWRCGSDNSVGAGGWFVDSVTFPDSAFLCCLPAPVIQPVAFNGSQLTVPWTAVSGKVYRVDYRTNLTAGSWTLLGNVTAATYSATTMDNVPLTIPQRFYRVVLTP